MWTRRGALRPVFRPPWMEGPIISAFRELRDLGHFGVECLKLTDRLVREEARRFPVLTRGGEWQAVDLEDLVGEFLADRLIPVTANLLSLATSDDSMGRLLRRSIKNWLVDQARKTTVGALRRSLETMLSADDAFEQVPPGEVGAGRWRLVGSAVQPWSGTSSDLIRAAHAVPNVRIPKWSTSTRRQPIADRASMVAVARAVLSAAGGSLETGQIVYVFSARFPAALDPVVVPLEEGPVDSAARDDSLNPEELVIAVDDEIGSAVTAAEIVGMLSPEERRVVPHLDDLSMIQAMVGCGKSQASHRAKRLREKLDQLIGEPEDLRAVRLEVIRLCGIAAVAE